MAALSGDARRCLDICRRAVEIAETQNESSKQQQSQNDQVKATTRRKSSAKGNHFELMISRGLNFAIYDQICETRYINFIYIIMILIKSHQNT